MSGIPISIIMYRDGHGISHYYAFSSNDPGIELHKFVERIYQHLDLPLHGIDDMFILNGQPEHYYLREITTTRLTITELNQGLWIALKSNGGISHSCKFMATEQELRDDPYFEECFRAIHVWNQYL